MGTNQQSKNAFLHSQYPPPYSQETLKEIDAARLRSAAAILDHSRLVLRALMEDPDIAYALNYISGKGDSDLISPEFVRYALGNEKFEQWLADHERAMYGVGNAVLPESSRYQDLTTFRRTVEVKVPPQEANEA